VRSERLAMKTTLYFDPGRKRKFSAIRE
jgi:hypothetical protein